MGWFAQFCPDWARALPWVSPSMIRVARAGASPPARTASMTWTCSATAAWPKFSVGCGRPRCMARSCACSPSATSASSTRSPTGPWPGSPPRHRGCWPGPRPVRRVGYGVDWNAD